MGPGLLESTYEAVLEFELRRRGFRVERQKYIDLTYDELFVPRAFCIDLLVNERVVIELKSAERLAPVHYKQVLTYLKLTNLRLGLLINFGQSTIKEGLHRIVNGYPDK